MTEKNQVIGIVDGALESNELLDQPKALLLLKMCQFCVSFAPERTAKYWEMLQKLTRSIPQANQAELTELRANLEESVSTQKKGFTAEMVAEIEEINKLDDVEQKKEKLQDCQVRLKKRFNPIGKGPVWTALVHAWLPLDHNTAFQLMKNISGKSQNDILKQLNSAVQIKPEEWDFLYQTLGKGKMETLVLEILADDNLNIQLSDALVEETAKKIRSLVPQFSTPINTDTIVKHLHNHTRLLVLHARKEKEELISNLIAEMVIMLAKASWLDQSWMERFNLIQALIAGGEGLEKNGLEILTPSFTEQVIKDTPPYLQNFIYATIAARSTKADTISVKYAELMQKISNDETGEAWFFVQLVERGFCKEAMQGAQKSARAETLLPRLRRAWICKAPETACTVIKPADMKGDVIGEFLAYGTQAKRAEFLAKITEQGKKNIPGAMWAGVGTEDESEGVRGFWANLTAHQKSFDEIITEYLNLNPLYSSYSRSTKKEEQFSINLAVNGFGRYTYQQIDTALLGAMTVWADKDQATVHSVLKMMWNTIRPDDNLLRVDWLRNAILSRCMTVFGPDQPVLFDEYLEWLKTELVKKGRQWQIGKQIITLKYPNTAPFQFSLIAASSISSYSIARRDQIIITGLQRFDANEGLIENAAMIYNGGKPIMDLKPPTSIKSNFLPSWQTGIVKNAIPSIVKALLLEKVNQG